MTSTSYSSGADYWVQKGGQAYSGSWSTSGLSHSYSDKSSGNQYGAPRTYTGHTLYAVGNNWVQHTTCASAVHADDMCEWNHTETSSCVGSSSTSSMTSCVNSGYTSRNINYGHCSSSSNTNASPSSCSDSSSFSTSVVTNISFSNSSNDVVFGSLTLMIRPNFDANMTSESSALVSIGPSPDWNQKITGMDSSISDNVSTTEEDRDLRCYRGTSSSSNASAYKYGSSSTPASYGSATSLSAQDGINFMYCLHPQQLMSCCIKGYSCCNLDSTPSLSGGNCCNGDFCSACNNTTVNTSRMRKAAVYRPYTMYWYAVLGGGSSYVCEAGQDDGTNCALFNGVVKKNDDSASSHFDYEPNPYVSPTDTEKQGSEGPRLGVPVQYSLLYSADGGAPSESSFLARFLKSTSCGTSSGTEVYSNQCGWQALSEFYTRLHGMLQPSDSVDEYDQFATMYWSYAVLQRYGLSLFQLASFASIDGVTKAPLAFFMTSGEWSGNAITPYTQIAMTTTDGATARANLTGSDLFALGHPSVNPVDGNMQITLTFFCPALLLPWMTDMDKVAALVERMFPRTDKDSYELGISFSESDAFELVSSLGADQSSSVFQIAEVSESTYYHVSKSSPSTPIEGQPSSNSSSEAIVAARVSAKLNVATGSLTTLFYLYYLKQNGTPLPNVANFLADGEPVPTLPPDQLNWGTGCLILESGVCSEQTGYAQTGGWRVNALFISGDSAACKCLMNDNLPSTMTSGAAVWNAESLCFNANCDTTYDMLVDLDSMTAAAASASVCPSSAAAVATLSDNGIGSVTVTAGGALYDQAPAVTFVGGGGSAAVATAIVENGSVVSVEVTSPGSNYTSIPQVVFVPQADASLEAPECSSYCSSYIDILEGGGVDLGNVDLTKMVSDCNLDILDLVSGGSYASLKFLLTGIFAVSAMPLLYIVVALISGIQAYRAGTPFANTLAADPFFFVPVIVLALVFAIAFVYGWFDLNGTQLCGSRKPADADGFSYPSSACMSKGFFDPYIPSYELPQEFCKSAQVYCECSNPELFNCATDSCGCTSSSCCSVEGLCNAKQLTDSPLIGRTITARTTTLTWTPLTLAFCAAIAMLIVPTVTSAFYMLTPDFGITKVVVTFLISVVLLFSSCVPAYVFYADSEQNTTLSIGVGSCSALIDYPTTLTLTTDDTIVFVQDTAADGDLPQYVRSGTPDCSCCYGITTSKDACETGCSDVDNCDCVSMDAASGDSVVCYASIPPVIKYDEDWEAWIAYDPDNDDALVLVNVQGSGMIYQQTETLDDEGNVVENAVDAVQKPPMYATFQAVESTLAQNTLTFCGTLDGVPSCTNCVCETAE